jgi:RNA polymerase-binding transcription factor DksA
MLDHDNPSADADGASALVLIQHAEQRLWEVEQALARLEEGSCGYCTTCGEGIPLERLWALPATMSRIACSDRWSFRTRSQIDEDRDAARHARWRSLSARGGSGQEFSR